MHKFHELFLTICLIVVMIRYQAQNASLAIATTKLFNSNISYETINKGLRNVYWPGRLQLVADKTYYDVAHNENGVKSVLNNLNRMFPTSKLYGLLCLKGDKEIDCIAESIKSQFEMLFVSTSKDGLLMEPEKLSEELHNLKVINFPLNDISSSISKIKKVRKPDDVILIFGSHYIANEIFSEYCICVSMCLKIPLFSEEKILDNDLNC